MTWSVAKRDGTFNAATNFATAASPNSVALADVNGDGILDVIAGNYGGGTVSVLLGGAASNLPPTSGDGVRLRDTPYLVDLSGERLHVGGGKVIRKVDSGRY